jgi:ribosomal protein S18 acetylase RimI-like enzyme
MIAERSIVPAGVTAEEAEDFNRLFVISAPKFVPALYGGVHERVNRNLFRYTGNILSFEHTSFMKVDGRNAGMIVTYDWRQSKGQQFKTSMLILRYMRARFLRQARHLQWAGDELGQMEDGTYYIACLAFYEDFRNRGLGAEIMSHTQEAAARAGATRLELDAETYNQDAIRFYKRFGMAEAGEPRGTTIGGEYFEFIRLSKDIK